MCRIETLVWVSTIFFYLGETTPLGVAEEGGANNGWDHGREELKGARLWREIERERVWEGYQDWEGAVNVKYLPKFQV